MRRIVVVGSAGCGKTWLARRLACLLNLPHVELDTLHWGPGWTRPPPDTFRRVVSEATSAEGWIADGNYSEVRDLTWGRADTIIWMDYPIAVAYRRLLWRTLGRMVSRKVLWNGNRETFRGAFLEPDNLFAYVRKTHRRRRESYAELFASPDYAQVRRIRLRSPGQVRGWLRSVAQRL